MALAIGDDVCDRLCDALGLSKDAVLSIEIKAEYGSVAMVTIKRCLSNDELRDVAAALEASREEIGIYEKFYRLVPEPPDEMWLKEKADATKT